MWRTHERGSVIVTSNLPFEEWTSVFGSERLTGAFLVDLRDTTSALGERELLSLRREFGRHNEAFHGRAAFLVLDLEQRVSNAILIQACAALVGIELRAFVESDVAIRWLPGM